MQRKRLLGLAAITAIAVALAASIPALSFAAPSRARFAVQAQLSDVQAQPSEANELTFSLFVHRNYTRLTELGYTVHYNGFVYPIEGLQVKLFRVERTITEEGENRTITISVTLVGEGTTDVNGEVSFTVRPGYYFLKIVIGEHEITTGRPPLLVFSDRSIYVPLESLIHHRPYGEHRDAPQPRRDA